MPTVVEHKERHETATKIKQALIMPEREQGLRMVAMQQRLSEYDICAWAKDFISGLEKNGVTGTRQL